MLLLADIILTEVNLKLTPQACWLARLALSKGDSEEPTKLSGRAVANRLAQSSLPLTSRRNRVRTTLRKIVWKTGKRKEEESREG